MAGAGPISDATNGSGKAFILPRWRGPGKPRRALGPAVNGRERVPKSLLQITRGRWVQGPLLSFELFYEDIDAVERTRIYDATGQVFEMNFSLVDFDTPRTHAVIPNAPLRVLIRVTGHLFPPSSTNAGSEQAPFPGMLSGYGSVQVASPADRPGACPQCGTVAAT